MDQAPGPSIASATAMVANRSWAQKSPSFENADHNATTESAPPAIGVHNPAQSNSPAVPSIRIRKKLGSETNPLMTWWTVAIAAISRRHKRPAPG